MAVTISSHLFSTNQMLLAGIPANSIHSLRELSHAIYAFQWQWISFWLEMEPPNVERDLGCSGLERPLARFELEETRKQKFCSDRYATVLLRSCGGPYAVSLINTYEV